MDVSTMETARNKTADRLFLFYVLILVVFGLTALTSASAPVGYDRFGDTYYFIKRQILAGLLPGLVLFLILAHLRYNLWKKWSSALYFLSIILLIGVFVPGLGLAINNARSWIAVGAYTFQPSEFAKLALIVILAKLLTDERRNLNDWQYGLLPVLSILAVPLGLIALQPDVGTLAIMVILLFVMLYLGDVSRKYLIIMGGACIIAFALLMMAAPYRVQRLTTFLHPELDPQGVGYQINQAYLAVGSGGFWGLGLGHSRQKFQYLPEVQADSIFAIIAEEGGFLWTLAMVVILLLIGLRAMQVAKSAPDKFSRLVAAGVGAWFVGQSFVNISSMIGLLPLTGVPLPFVSHGGSALMMAMGGVGVVASISRG